MHFIFDLVQGTADAGRTTQRIQCESKVPGVFLQQSADVCFCITAGTGGAKDDCAHADTFNTFYSLIFSCRPVFYESDLASYTGYCGCGAVSPDN